MCNSPGGGKVLPRVGFKKSDFCHPSLRLRRAGGADPTGNGGHRYAVLVNKARGCATEQGRGSVRSAPYVPHGCARAAHSRALVPTLGSPVRAGDGLLPTAGRS